MPVVVAQASPGPLSLALQGMLYPVVVVGPTGRPITAQALFDTGSTISSISMSLIQRVGAVQVGQADITTVTTASALEPIYNARILFPSGMPITNGIPGELGDGLSGATQVLVGNDILSQFIVDRNGPAGTWSISVPNTTPVPFSPPTNATNFWIGVSGLAVAAAAATALALTHRNEEREIADLRRQLGARRAS